MADHHEDSPSGDRTYDSWSDNRKLVLDSIREERRDSEKMWAELARIDRDKVSREYHDKLDERIRLAESTIVGLKVRASVWGGLAGLIPIVLWLALRAISGAGK